MRERKHTWVCPTQGVCCSLKKLLPLLLVSFPQSPKPLVLLQLNCPCHRTLLGKCSSDLGLGRSRWSPTPHRQEEAGFPCRIPARADPLLLQLQTNHSQIGHANLGKPADSRLCGVGNELVSRMLVSQQGVLYGVGEREGCWPLGGRADQDWCLQEGSTLWIFGNPLSP